jgi:hypothetical protein
LMKQQVISGSFWARMEVPIGITCQECKSVFTQIPNTQLLKCKCGHIISVQVYVEGAPSMQDITQARKLDNPFLNKIRNKPPVGG